MNSNDEEQVLIETPLDIKEATALASDDLLPNKSRNQYERQYKNFMNWRLSYKTNSISEDVLMVYFHHLAKKMKPSSLWAIYSMLRTTINVKNNTDIGKYPKLCAFLKRTLDGYKPKKSKILTSQQIQEFISTAPDETYLFTKVGLIFGIMGACRREELMKIETNHVEDQQTALLVNIPDTITKTERQFVIEGSLYGICKKYMELRPANLTNNTRFFLNYQKGKCTKQPIGINKFGSLASQVATFLKLPDSNLYTAHCFRRSSPTILIDSGADITAEGYIDHSLNNKIQTANKILHSIESSSKETNEITKTLNTNIINEKNTNFDVNNSGQLMLTFNNCQNVTIFIHKPK